MIVSKLKHNTPQRPHSVKSHLTRKYFLMHKNDNWLTATTEHIQYIRQHISTLYYKQVPVNVLLSTRPGSHWVCVHDLTWHQNDLKFPWLKSATWIYSVSQTPLKFYDIFPKWLGIFSPNFTHLLYVPICTGLQIFFQLPATLTKLCHIKRDHHNLLKMSTIDRNARWVVALNMA